MSHSTDKEHLEEGSKLRLDYSKLKQVGTAQENVLPVVVQDAVTREVLIMCYANRLALEKCGSKGRPQAICCGSKKYGSIVNRTRSSTW